MRPMLVNVLIMYVTHQKYSLIVCEGVDFIHYHISPPIARVLT